MTFPLTTLDEQRIAPSQQEIPLLATLTYTLTFTEVPDGTGNNFLQFSLTPPEGWSIQSDPALSMRVPNTLANSALGCRLRIMLDNKLRWHFRKGNDLTKIEQNPITVGKGSNPQYFNLGFDNEDDQLISFDALYDSGHSGAIDQFNLYVNLDQSNSTEQVPIRIDPDIINPGNHP